MIKNRKNVWVCLAAHGPNIKENRVHAWRCCLRSPGGDNLSAEIPLVDCKVFGRVSERNHLFRADSKGGTCMQGVVGWIEMYGDVEIHDDILCITLGEPS